MRDYPGLLFKVAMAWLALVLLVVALLYILKEPARENALFGVVVFAVLGVILGALSFFASLAFIYEIATSKNGWQWKAVWIIPILLLGVIGAGIYIYVARKERIT